MVEDTKLLARWDVAKSLELLTGNVILLDQNLAQPLIKSCPLERVVS